MKTQAQPFPGVAPLDPRSAFTLVLRGEAGGPELAREPVTCADLLDAFSETWRDGCLRRGCPGLPLESADIRLFPVFADDTRARCVGFELEARPPSERPTRREFSLRYLEPVANRLIGRLREAGTLQSPSKVVFDVIPSSIPNLVPGSAPAPDTAGPAFAVKTAPLSYLKVPLRPLLEQARAANAVSEESFAVFYTEETLNRAEACARRGDQCHPAVETGAVLLGSLCSCPDSGEFFCIITEVLAVEDADQSVFSLAYSGRSWQRIQTVLKAKQAAQPARADRLLGQAHGHNYRPNDGVICEQCPTLPVCNLTNVFASQDDHLWSRAVFVRQPWQLCHIFGWSARGDRHQGLFTLQGGRLQERGFYVLPEFDVNAWAGRPALQ